MKKLLVGLLGIAAFWGGLSYYEDHFRQSKPHAGSSSQEVRSQPDGPQPEDMNAKSGVPEISEYVKVTGPLASWMDKANPGHKTPEPVAPRLPAPGDHVAASPVGTSNTIVHKTFAITSAAKFAFEVPPHAASPQLSGSYRSFTQQAGTQSSDGADVDLLLMNAEQYADFSGGRPADVVYSVDSSHEQDVAFGLPATFDKPAQYYLVFRNSSGHAGKKVVQAAFRVDF